MNAVSTSGCLDKSTQAHDRVLAVVSWPAKKSAITSSRSSLSLIWRPLSSSRAWTSIDSKSPRSSPLAARLKMMSLISQPAYGVLDPQIQGRGNPVRRCHKVAAPRRSQVQGFQGRADMDRFPADLRTKSVLATISKVSRIMSV